MKSIPDLEGDIFTKVSLESLLHENSERLISTNQKGNFII